MIDTANWSAWGIRPEYLEGLLNDPNTVVKIRSAADDPEVLASIRGQGDRGDKAYKIVDGVALIPVTGPLSKRMSFLTWIMGGRTFGQLAEMIGQAVDDPEVNAIVLDVDSPGGTVSGTDAFAEAVAAAAAEKPVVAYANGCMCSAAYWASSPASLVIAERTAAVGSIGVIMVHADFSKMDERWGVKYTVLTAGKYKAVGNNMNPLSDEDRVVLQAELDKLYGVFVAAVAGYRGAGEDAVRKDMAEGRVFIGEDAVTAGLADRVGNLQAAIDAARALADQVYSGELVLPINPGALPPTKESDNMSGEKKKMIAAPQTVAELEAALPDLAVELRDQGAKSVDTAAAGAAERERIMGLVTVHFGAEASAKFAAVVKTGVTEEQYKAIVGDTAPGMLQSQIIGDKEQILAALAQAGADNPGADNLGIGGGKGKDFMGLVDEYRALHKCSFVEAMRKVIKNNPKTHAEYLAAMNKHLN